MAEAMRLPVVVIVTQRGGPSTGTVIYSQQEVTLSCLGGNGEGMRIVYSPSTHQEIYDYIIKAFRMAWQYRLPVIVLGDGYQSKMREAVTIYNPGEPVVGEPYLGRPGMPGREREPVHLRNTYNLEEELYEQVVAAAGALARMADEVAEFQEADSADADLMVVAHGVVARAALAAVARLREAGYPVGYFRPVTLRPFPAWPLRRRLGRGRSLLVVESAYGQLSRLVAEALVGYPYRMHGLWRPAMGITVEEIVDEAKKVLEEGSDAGR